MSAITAGSVIDVATSRGLSTAIITHVNGGALEGWEVAPRDHTAILRPYNGHVEDEVFQHDGERAIIISLAEGEIVAYTESEDDGVTIYSPTSRPRNVRKDVKSVLSAIIATLRNAEDTENLNEIQKFPEFYESFIASTLNIKN